MEELGDRVKMFEAEREYSIPRDRAFALRLDGHGFSKLTKGFKKPFDEDFSRARRSRLTRICG